MGTARIFVVAAIAMLIIVCATRDRAEAYACPPGYTYHGGHCVPHNAYPSPWGGYGGYYGQWGPYGPRDPDKDRSGCSASLLACQQQCEAMRPNMTRRNYIQCRQTCQMGFEACIY